MFPVDIAKFLRTGFFYRIPPVAASDSPTTVHLSQGGCVFFDFASPYDFHFDQKLTKNVTQIILYYHMTK